MNQLIIDHQHKLNINYDELINNLVALNYQKTHMVLEPGEFSVRGSIIDIFPIGTDKPLRLEYADNQLESIRIFDLHTQRSKNNLENTMTINKIDKFHHFLSVTYKDEEKAHVLMDDLKIGDYVVHVHHGIGIFKGLKKLTIGQTESEYLFIKYAEHDKLYIPLDQISLVHKYSGQEFNPKITTLGDGNWDKAKKKAKKSAENIAHDLLQIYRIRQTQRGHSFSPDSMWQIDLEENFEYEETKDQLTAAEDVKKDMEGHLPMDRLICGDVGYGKTEVALRAAFKASTDNKQVAILVPTTILAEQHYNTFSKRFSHFGHNIELLSRFKSKTEQKKILNDLALGKIDVVIGTHRLLQKDVQFKDLGLVIIDEEQRFGVKDKEKLKKLRVTVDILTLTATPIPRTLYMSLSGAKDLNIINTAPKNRLPIKTILTEYDEDLIKKAIENELKRNGQIYYVHNNISTIHLIKLKIEKLIPYSKACIGHGKMKVHDLEKIMIDFLKNKYDVLICTTIIESGLDIPNVNTIIIDTVENFGLAQLHQLRGRVGRSNRKAYAYLMYHPGKVLTETAKKRLQSIKEYTALGSGYKIALKDLEIRGAGNLLGQEQSGHIAAVGFELYCQLLEESVNKVKGIKTKQKPILMLDPQTKSFIPDDYIQSEQERIAIYRRMMNFEIKDDVEDLIWELIDRYGPLPYIVEQLLLSLKRQL